MNVAHLTSEQRVRDVCLNVAHLTSVHPVQDVRIFYKQCTELVNAGHNVFLVACHETSHKLNGINIQAAKMHKNRLSRATITSRDIYRTAKRLGADVYHIHDPELIPVGMLLKMRGKKVIYDAHEDLPKQIMGKPWIPFYLRQVTSKIASTVLFASSRFFFSGIVAATPSIKNNFPVSKTELVCNFPKLDEFVFSDGLPFSERPHHVAYIGGISQARAIKEIVQSLELNTGMDIRLKLCGKFQNKELEFEMTKRQGWKQVDFVGWLNRTQVGELLANVRAGLVLFYPEKNHVHSQPNKLFEYMAAGIPVVASNFPLWKEIVEGSKCGLCVDPLNPKEIIDAIQWLMENPGEAETMGSNGRKAIEKKYNWENEGKKLLAMYQKIASA